MNSTKCFLFCLLCLMSCTNKKTLLNNLYLVNNKYCLHGKENPFTGEVISKFEDGKTSNDLNFKNGVPIGNWVAYGYAGEIIQSGTYRPISIKGNDETKKFGIVRINLCFTQEGNEDFVDILIVTNKFKLEVDKRKDTSIYKALIDILESNKIKIDDNKINNIRCTNGELER